MFILPPARVATLGLVVVCLISGIALRAPDLVACAAGLLAALAVERLPWAVLLAPMLTRLGARAAAGDEAAA
jgi:hypothetical protein